MSLEQKAQILETATQKLCGVRDVVQTLSCKASRAILLLREMKEERLIELKQARSLKRGRPKKVIVCTLLGLELLEAYVKAKMKPLRARRTDFERAVKDALYAERLDADGHSTFELFMELNTIAGNIKVSSEITANTGKA